MSESGSESGAAAQAAAPETSLIGGVQEALVRFRDEQLVPLLQRVGALEQRLAERDVPAAAAADPAVSAAQDVEQPPLDAAGRPTV